MKKKVAVVILNWNGRELLERFLPPLLQYTPADKADIIVADNASEDDSLAFLEARYPEVGLIRLEQNYGFALGYNKALASCAYEYCVLLNSDVKVADGWLEPLLDYMEQHPEVAAAQPKICSLRRPECFEYAGAAGGYLDKYGYPFCRGRIQQDIEPDSGQYDTIRTVCWASGACLFVRMSDFHTLGGFDAGFFAHQEEIDLCWRLLSRQRKVVCVPSSVVFHLGGASLDQESPRKTFLNFRNNLLMLYKNLPEEDLKRVLFIRFWLDYLAALVFLLKGQFGNVGAVWKARRSFSSLKKEYKTVRKEVQAVRLIAYPDEMYPNCILLDYYLRGKKLFSQLGF